MAPRVLAALVLGVFAWTTQAHADCRAEGWTAAAEVNAQNLSTLTWAPFGRVEVGWESYAPLIAWTTGSDCPAHSEGFASAFAAWQATAGLAPTGVVTDSDFRNLKSAWQARRPFIRQISEGACPETADVIAAAHAGEAYPGKTVWAHPDALAAHRRMLAAARAEVPEIAADIRTLTLFSGYRSPTLDAARCAVEGNCDGVARARCSAHRTGMAMDLYIGEAPGFSADSTAAESRLFLSRTPAYRWLVANGERFGFTNYAFEPWHWEWTGPAP